MSDTENLNLDDVQGLGLDGVESDIDETVGEFHRYRPNVSGLYKWGLPIRLAPMPAPLKPGSSILQDIDDELDDDIDLEALLSSDATNEPFADELEAALPMFIRSEELRLDVDGRYPQMTASGRITNGWRQTSNWIAKLKSYGRHGWLGWIWYKHPSSTTFPYTRVYLRARRSLYPHQREVTAIFFGGGAPRRVRTYKYASAYFHPAEFEFDCEAGTSPVLSIDTHAHPNHPSSLPRTSALTPEKTYRRAGFEARRTRGANVIPNSVPGTNNTWSDGEMHDAMQTYWSRFNNHPQWSLWTLWAKLHDRGNSLGGIMFDDIGPNHRQGTSVFEDSFISGPAPSGDPAPNAYTRRLNYWTLIHEMGHSFNLAHSWQKHMGTPMAPGDPWIPLVSNSEDRSFMNYPFAVSGGEASFFGDFEYRFTDQELLFLRHAPGQFVQQGNADWFDNHGFEVPEEHDAMSRNTDLGLEIGFNRQKPRFEYLEPVMLEVQIKNNSSQVQSIPAGLIKDADHVTVIIKKKGQAARQWYPYARYLMSPALKALNPGEAHSEDLFISAGLNGWDLAEPGFYDIQVQVMLEDGVLTSNRMSIQVEVPKSRQEEILAQDIFTDEAGRVMKFDGSTELESGIEAWQNLVDLLPESKAADHALLALALPKTRNYRRLDITTAADQPYLDANVAFKASKADPDAAGKMLQEALVKNPQAAADTLGFQDFVSYCRKCENWRKSDGDTDGGKVFAKAAKTAKPRHVHDYPHVLKAAD